MDDNVESRPPENESGSVAIMEAELIGNESPSHEEIAVLAYSYWEARGYQSVSRGGLVPSGAGIARPTDRRGSLTSAQKAIRLK